MVERKDQGRKISRRKFLKLVGGVVGTIAFGRKVAVLAKEGEDLLQQETKPGQAKVICNAEGNQNYPKVAVITPTPEGSYKTGWIPPTEEELKRAEFIDFETPHWQAVMETLSTSVSYQDYVSWIYDQHFNDCVPSALAIVKMVQQGVQFEGWSKGLAGRPSPIFIYGQRGNKSCDCGIGVGEGIWLLTDKGYAMQDVMTYGYDPNKEPNEYQLDHGYPYRGIYHSSWLFNRWPGSSTPVDLEALKAFLADQGPWLLGIPIYESFGETPSSGKIPLPKESESLIGLHVLAVIGYDDILYGGTFIVVNSWGTDWGKGGIGHLPYAYLNENAKVREQQITGSAVLDSQLDCEEMPDDNSLPDFCVTPTPTPTPTPTVYEIYFPLVGKGGT